MFTDMLAAAFARLVAAINAVNARVDGITINIDGGTPSGGPSAFNVDGGGP